ncbi:MBL fold metallo-hydrolase [Paraburkholderia sp. MM5384-R2]|uniref:MBL fold metallo-hydrolase n=1 Tax=Paraburkholderia sp. MM5384-R2 TaxID=2723097 RepID=UPI0016178032|nr:MBL fold metallo-hydrolase [Paraburkholderia sp. MM5384-R2]MBB5499329.1 glyoxylase-like metal-dependent hydrolase (beta-lactamase superfamily II) [Paraburkholderia sp. MM5384-R2]
MLFRQMFDSASSTYTYLLASRAGGEALVIDPVKEQLGQYLTVIRELGLRLVHAIDTHIHADHITALGDLRDATACATIMGERSKADCISRRVHDNELVIVDGIALRAVYTPGHTNESFSFVLNPTEPTAVFTGDVLLIRGSGRTDFQGGDPRQSYDSIVNKLFSLPDATTLYPAHDYKGWTASSIGEEKNFNPRLAGKTEAEYIEIMNGLHLPNPKMMDAAIPANLACGQPSTPLRRQG